MTDKTQSGRVHGCLCHPFQKPLFSLVHTKLQLWCFQIKTWQAEFPNLSVLGARKRQHSVGARCNSAKVMHIETKMYQCGHRKSVTNELVICWKQFRKILFILIEGLSEKTLLCMVSKSCLQMGQTRNWIGFSIGLLAYWLHQKADSGRIGQLDMKLLGQRKVTLINMGV